MNKSLSLGGLLLAAGLLLSSCADNRISEVYLANGSERVYSGGVIDMGVARYDSVIALDASLTLVNESGKDLTVTPVSAAKVAPVSGYGYYQLAGGYYVDWDNADDGPITIGTDMASSSLPKDAELPFVLRFCPADSAYAGNANLGRGEWEQKYKVALSDQQGNDFDFVFEVYGVVAC